MFAPLFLLGLAWSPMNKLYFGDNLEVLKKLHKEYPSGLVDLIYIDPPFNSKRNYNVFFESIDLSDTKAQKEAFADTWSNVSYLDTLNEIKEFDLDLYNFLNALDQIRLSKGAISYLAIMAIRIWYMHKVLKDTGSFYLHCDSTMSHYLKLVCDLIFGEKNFRNEIVWCYRGAGYPKKDFGKRHDTILRYSKTDNYKFNLDEVREEYAETTKERFKHYIGNIRDGKDFGTQSLHPLGKQPDDWWQIQPIAPSANERLGYPTQKPELLLERIIKASSDKGDTILDCFCGCGTTIAVAENLNRNWIGVDISHLATRLITKRLIDTYGLEIRKSFEVFGFPKDIASAKELATGTKGGRLKFEGWIIEVMLHGVLNVQKNRTGFDGYLTFDIQGKKETVLIEVKSGNVNLPQVNHFITTVKEKNAGVGVFVCFKEQITPGMRQTAKKQGYYLEEFFGSNYDKIQIITVEDLLEDKMINIPTSTKGTFKTAVRDNKKDKKQTTFL